MRVRLLSLFVILSGCSIAAWANSEPLWVWEDTNSKATPEYVAANHTTLFTQRAERYVGLTGSTWWIKLPPREDKSQAYLVFDIRLPNVDLVIARGEDIYVLESGDGVAVSARPISVAPIVFDVSDLGGKDTQLFLRLKSPGEVMRLDHSLTDIEGVLSKSDRAAAALFIAVSLLLLLMLINIINFIKTREGPFIFYTGYLFCALLAAMERLGGFALLDIPTRIGNASIIFVIGASTYIFFVITVLTLFKQFKSRWFRLPLFVSMLIALIFLIFALIDGQLAFAIYNLGGGSAITLLVTGGLMYAALKRVAFADLALLGWFCAVISGGFSALYTSGILPISFHGVFVVGFIAEGTIFTLLLAAQHSHSLQLALYEQSREAELLRTSQLAVLGEWTATISHEMKQPLNAIKLVLANVKIQVERHPEKIAQSLPPKLSRLNEMVERAIELCDFVRRSSRIVSGENPRADISDSLTGCMLMFAKELSSADIDFRYAVAPAIPKIGIDPLHLDQIIINLITNARDAINDSQTGERWISFAASQSSPDSVDITLEDSAGGIPAHVMDKVFEKFFTTKGAEQGTGIGLAVSRQLADQAGGSLTVSNSEHGARFCLTLPVYREQEGAQPPDASLTPLSLVEPE